jgi:8-oxo-dGTP pyrophosphatase MutT (NUDIX family)
MNTSQPVNAGNPWSDGMPAWWAQAKAQARQAPPLPRMPLRVGHVVVGSVDQQVAGLLARQMPGITHGFGSLRIAAAQADATLARAARVLHDAGITLPWRDELLAVCDEHGQRYSVIERAAVRPLGIRTEAVHLVGYGAQDQVWVQQRALNKATDPGKWDTLAGGLVSAAEGDLLTAIARETWEEAGLHTTALKVRHAATFRQQRLIDQHGYLVEDLVLYEAQIPPSMTPRNQDGEVARFALLSVDKVIEMLQSGQFTLEATLMLAESFAQRNVLRA